MISLTLAKLQVPPLMLVLPAPAGRARQRTALPARAGTLDKIEQDYYTMMINIIAKISLPYNYYPIQFPRLKIEKLCWFYRMA